jgi:hypothetical protein
MPHTPGPWFAGTDEDAHVIYNADESEVVADTLREDGDAETEAANARLVAAAPDLLAACESVLLLIDGRGLGGLDVLGQFYADRCDEEAAKVRAALAKAKGG